jgi:hypothetical protein
MTCDVVRSAVRSGPWGVGGGGAAGPFSGEGGVCLPPSSFLSASKAKVVPPSLLSPPASAFRTVHHPLSAVSWCPPPDNDGDDCAWKEQLHTEFFRVVNFGAAF